LKDEHEFVWPNRQLSILGQLKLLLKNVRGIVLPHRQPLILGQLKRLWLCALPCAQQNPQSLIQVQ
jgi:hypothetical protein